MLASVYDPNSIAGDVFDMDNMVEGSTNLILTASERSAIAANTAKVTNATHTGDVTGDSALTLESVAITGQAETTIASDDYVVFSDTSDSGALKKALASDLQGSGSDSDAIHDNVAAEISALTEKSSPADADVIVIEDSADSYNKKKVLISNLPSGSGGGSPAPLRWGWAGTLSTGSIFRHEIRETCTISEAYASVATPGTGASILIQIHKLSGPSDAAESDDTDSIFSSDGTITIAAGGYYATGTLDSGQVSCTAGDVLEVEIQQVGSTVAGADLYVVVSFS
jgi:hypothetical protein